MPSAELFVYGDLLRGQEREGLVTAFPVCAARVRGTLWQLPRGEPALLPDESDGWVLGELLALDDPRVLGVLDLMHGTGHAGFRRATVPCACDRGLLEAQAYVMSPSDLRHQGARPLGVNDWRLASRSRRR